MELLVGVDLFADFVRRKAFLRCTPLALVFALVFALVLVDLFFRFDFFEGMQKVYHQRFRFCTPADEKGLWEGSSACREHLIGMDSMPINTRQMRLFEIPKRTEPVFREDARAGTE